MRSRRPVQIGHKLVVDIFAGCGGASLGIRAALGREIDHALNHDPQAVEVHELNHPRTRHHCADAVEAVPLEITGGAPVGLAWFSPDCTHHSRAKGGKPRDKNIRALAWVVVRWAKEVRPDVIMLENVPEFAEWGPLDRHGKPVKSKRGETFRAWVAALKDEGYQVEWRVLCAADYGAPTIRRRLFLVARCDGRPVRWPAPTHAPRERAAGLGLLPWVSAASCIDWSLPVHSIFLTPEEAKRVGVRRPLADATLRRIAIGLRRYVLEAEEPFIVRCNHGGEEFRGQGLTDPMCTLTSRRDAYGLVVPNVVIQTGHQSDDAGKVRRPDDPLSTIVTKAEHCLVAPTVIQYNGEKSEGESRGQSGRDPLNTVPTENRFGLVAATLAQTGYGEREGQAPRAIDVEKPLGTIVGGGCKHALVEAFLSKHYGGVVGHDLHRPVGTVTGTDHHAVSVAHLAASHLEQMNGTGQGRDVREPLGTVTSGGQHVAEVRAFLVKYFGTATGQDLADPLGTATARARFGLVLVDGVPHQVVDIGMRMLEPAELLRAQFGPFAGEYRLIGSKARRIHAIGNSVPPQVAEALVRENL